MSFLSTSWLGIRVWIWLYFLLSVIGGVVVALYWHREKIKKKYYEFRFPEKLLKVVIHYKTGFFREYWRLIPESKYFTVESKDYSFDDKSIIRENDFFSTKKGDKTTIKIAGKSYNFNELIPIKKRGRDYPEIHYFFNVPSPIKFDIKKKDIKLTGQELHDFKENDLFGKLLTLDTQQNLMIFALVLLFVILMLSGVGVAIDLGWIKVTTGG